MPKIPSLRFLCQALSGISANQKSSVALTSINLLCKENNAKNFPSFTGIKLEEKVLYTLCASFDGGL